MSKKQAIKPINSNAPVSRKRHLKRVQEKQPQRFASNLKDALWQSKITIMSSAMIIEIPAWLVFVSEILLALLLSPNTFAIVLPVAIQFVQTIAAFQEQLG